MLFCVQVVVTRFESRSHLGSETKLFTSCGPHGCFMDTPQSSMNWLNLLIYRRLKKVRLCSFVEKRMNQEESENSVSVNFASHRTAIATCRHLGDKQSSLFDTSPKKSIYSSGCSFLFTIFERCFKALRFAGDSGILATKHVRTAAQH